jgi:hypothetical protein
LTALEARVVHRIPGRARLRISRARGQAAFLAEAERELASSPLVRRVEVSPVTGSILVFHDGPLEEVLAFAKERGVLEAPLDERPTYPLETIARDVAGLDERLRASSDNRWSVGDVGFFGLVAAAIYQVAQGKVLPPAATLLGQALNVFFRGLESDRRHAPPHGA